MSRALETLGKYKYLLLLLLLGLILLLWPTGGGGGAAPDEGRTEAEARLEAVLGEVSGAGRVSVLLCSHKRRRGFKGEPSPGVPPFLFFTLLRVRRYAGWWSLPCPAIRPHFFGACPKKRCRAAKEKRFFYLGGSTIRVSATGR